MEDTPTIIIRHTDNLWRITDLQGRVSDFQWRPVAVATAYKMFAGRPGMIVVYDALGRILETIDLRAHDPRNR